MSQGARNDGGCLASAHRRQNGSQCGLVPCWLTPMVARHSPGRDITQLSKIRRFSVCCTSGGATRRFLWHGTSDHAASCRVIETAPGHAAQRRKTNGTLTRLVGGFIDRG